MTHDEYARHVDAFLAEMREVTTRKNADYSAGSGDAMYDYRHTAEELGCSPREAWAVLFMKHVHAVLRWVKVGSVESEPIRGRFIDIANYAMLGCALDKDLTVEKKIDERLCCVPAKKKSHLYDRVQRAIASLGMRADHHSVYDLDKALLRWTGPEEDETLGDDLAEWAHDRYNISGSVLLSYILEILLKEKDVEIAGVST